MNPFIYKAKVLRIVDGDTCDVMLDLGFNSFMKGRVRLVGIDTPESRTRDLEEKARGLAAKQFVVDILKCSLINQIVCPQYYVGTSISYHLM